MTKTGCIPCAARFRLTAWLLCIAVFAFWILGQWPGIMNIDALSLYPNVRAGTLNADWFSLSYLGYWIAINSLWNTPGMLGIFQSLAAASGAVFLLDCARRGRAPAPLCWFFLALFLASPLTGMSNLIYKRDWLFGWLNVLICLYFPLRRINAASGPKLELKEAAAYAALIGFAATVRNEAVILLWVVPTALSLMGYLKRIQLAQFGAIMIATYFAFGPGLQAAFLPGGNADPVKAISAMVNPLSAILHSPESHRDPVLDRAAFDPVIDYDKLTHLYSPYEIPAFHSGMKSPLKPENYRRFVARFFTLIRDNPGIVLRNRWEMLLGLLGITIRSPFPDDQLVGNARPESIPLIQKLHLRKEPVLSRFATLQARMLHWADEGGSISRWSLQSYLIPFLILLALVTFGWQRVPGSAMGASILAARIGVVGLTTPAAQWMYLYDLYLFGFFAVPLAVAEWTSSRPKPLIDRASNREPSIWPETGQ
jgi:hypothetical protein